MKLRNTQILSLLIVGALVAIGAGANEACAVAIPIKTKAKLAHPALLSPLLLHGTANVNIVGGMVNLGVYYMIAPGGKALIQWLPASINPNGTFKAYGSGKAKIKNPLTGVIEHMSFRMVTKGRTNSLNKVGGRFTSIYSTVPGTGMKGRYHH